MSAEPVWIIVVAALLTIGLFVYLLYALFDAEHLE